jgi:hypothetical protein
MNMGQFNSLTFNIQLPIKKQLAFLAAAFIIGLMQSRIFFYYEGILDKFVHEKL